ncbi:unnamed protein product [Parnassius apollo]|uniref:(apollo) hypothetical protein n=1 Tax=Parnassius apollo TaxID=110799 RepID=A0A8S3VZA7_PARAO|nr:unnamed protein product [Parnassius apollo]
MFVTVNHIYDNWTRIRDCFKLSLKTTSGQSTKKKYMYSEMLQFLLKNMTPDETESSISSRKDDSEDDHSTHNTPSSIQPSTNKRVKMNPVDKEILNAIRSKLPKKELIDDDHAFLMSLLPTIKKFLMTKWISELKLCKS